MAYFFQRTGIDSASALGAVWALLNEARVLSFAGIWFAQYVATLFGGE